MRVDRITYIALAIISCLLVTGQNIGVALAQTRTERQDLLQVFNQKGLVGTFVLYDVNKDHLTIVNPQRAAKDMYPASTFKITNSLIALETKVVRDELEIIPFGGEPQLFKSWEKDMSMRDAINISNVPVYQELARRVGIKRYEHWLQKLNYGNGRVGPNVETFWLKGPLRISALSQAKFISRLATKTLPLSQRSQKTVSDMTELFKTRTGALHGKTGWSSAPSPQIGWFVGWISDVNGVFAFALNIDIYSKVDAKKRKPLALALLRKLDIL